jgi:hypothetical protein
VCLVVLSPKPSPLRRRATRTRTLEKVIIIQAASKQASKYVELGWKERRGDWI